MSSSFWMQVKDENTAREATKMGGLPIFMMGINIAIISYNLSGLNFIVSLVLYFVSAVFIIFSFRIRSGKVASLLALNIIFIVFLFLNLSLLIYLIYFHELLAVSRGAVLAGIPINILLLLFSISGIRGWLWLKRNNFEMSM